MDSVTEFESKIAKFFGAPYAIGTDSCTSALELCLIYNNATFMLSPKNTYLSVPMLAKKLGITLYWYDANWKHFYHVTQTIYDAAVLWEKNSYVPGIFMCISFQYQKHLSIGRAGCILTDNRKAAIELKKMAHDGRLPGIPWREQNVRSFGLHYYLQPELAAIGLKKLPEAIATPSRIWSSKDYPDVSEMNVFKNNI